MSRRVTSAEKEFSADYGSRLREIRERLDLSLEQAAAEIKLSNFHALARMETKGQDISAEVYRWVLKRAGQPALLYILTGIRPVVAESPAPYVVPPYSEFLKQINEDPALRATVKMLIETIERKDKP